MGSLSLPDAIWFSFRQVHFFHKSNKHSDDSTLVFNGLSEIACNFIALSQVLIEDVLTWVSEILCLLLSCGSWSLCWLPLVFVSFCAYSSSHYCFGGMGFLASAFFLEAVVGIFLVLGSGARESLKQMHISVLLTPAWVCHLDQQSSRRGLGQ